MKKLILLSVFAALLMSWPLHGKMNLDSLRMELAKVDTRSPEFEEYGTFLNNYASSEKEAKWLVADWIIKNALANGNYHLLADTYHSLGDFMLEEHDYAKANTFYTRALEIAERGKYYDVIGSVYNSYGLINYMFNQHDFAVENFNKAIWYTQMSDQRYGLGGYYYNLSMQYFQSFPESPDTIIKAINIARTGMNIMSEESNMFGVVTARNGLAQMFIAIEKYDSAYYYLKQNERDIHAHGIHKKFPAHYLRMGELYASMNEPEKALEFLDSGMVYVQDSGYSRWTYSYFEWYSKIYAEMKRYDEAYHYFYKYKVMHDSVLNEENYQLTEEIKTKYETEKKEAEILKLNNDNEVSRLRLEQKEYSQKILTGIIIGSTTILIVLIFLTIFLVRINLERKRANDELILGNLEIQRQANQLNEQSKLISRYQSQMNPHFVFNALSTIQGMIMNDQKVNTVRQLETLAGLMRDTINNSEKDFITLDAEIKYLRRYFEFERIKFANPIELELITPENPEEILIPPMMIQPFMENAFKHGCFSEIKDARIRVKMEVTPVALEIEITDNGAGFYAEDIVKSGESHAINMIIVRLKILWNVLPKTEIPSPLFSIISKPQLDRGTKVKLCLSLKYRY